MKLYARLSVSMLVSSIVSRCRSSLASIDDHDDCRQTPVETHNELRNQQPTNDEGL
jgi:hypothetical protein